MGTTARLVLALATLGIATLPSGAAPGDFGFSSHFARVNATGGVPNSSGVQSSSRVSTGVYRLVFNRNVKGCAATASIYDKLGNASVKYTTGNVNAIDVKTYTMSGTPANRAFHLIVICN